MKYYFYQFIFLLLFITNIFTQPYKVVITVQDKMKVKTSLFSYPKFVFKGKTYNKDTISNILNLADKQTKSYLKKYLSFNKFQTEKIYKYAKLMTNSFNAFLEKSDANRKIISDYLNKISYLKIIKKRKKLNYLDKKLKNKKIILLGFSIGGTTAFGEELTPIVSNLEPQFIFGLSFIYFNNDLLSNFNYGFSLDLNFYRFIEIGHYDSFKFSSGNFNAQFVITVWKHSWKYRFYSSIGLTSNFMVNKSSLKLNTGEIYETNNFILGGIIEIGLLRLFNKLKFAILYKNILKITQPQIKAQSNSSYKSKNIYFGFSLNFLFNIL